MKKLVSLILAALCVLTPALAAGSGTTVHTQLWDGHVWVDGTKSDFVDSQGKWAFLLSYNGTVYIPLRTAGDWMGATVDWDQKTQTVRMTTGGEPQVFFNYDGPAPTQAELAKYDGWRANGVDIALRPDLTVQVDGVVQSFTNVKGAPVYPVVFEGITYLPVRSIGELCGKEVTWIPASQQTSRERVVLHDPVTAAQKAEYKAYLDRERELVEQLRQQVDAVVEAGKLSDAKGLELLRAVQTTAAAMAAVPAPSITYFDEGVRCIQSGAKQMKQQFVDGFIGDVTGGTRSFAKLKTDGAMDIILDEWAGNMAGNLANAQEWLDALEG